LEGLFAETHATDNEVLEMDPTRIGKLESELPSSVSGRWPKLEWSGKVGNTCLHVAARRGDSAMAVCLLKARASPDIANAGSCTPLHDAAARGHLWVVQCLLRGGAEPNLQDLSLSTALHLAVAEGHIGTVKTLIAQDAAVEIVNERGESPLHCAVASGNIDIVEVLLDANSDIESITLANQTALHIASRLGHAEVVGLLIDRGASITTREENGSTALHLAARATTMEAHRQTERTVDEVMVADQNEEDDEEEEEQVLPSQSEVVKLLIIAGAEVNACNKRRETVLHYAAVGGHGPTMTNLLVARADPSKITGSGESVLHWAARSDNNAVVARLVEFGAYPAPKDDGGLIPLHEALRLGCLETAQILLEAMDAVGSKCWEGIGLLNLLHLAAQAADTGIVRLLLSREEFANYGGPILRNAVCAGDEAMVQSLLEAGVGIDCYDAAGAQGGLCETFLHDAANNGHTAIADLLMDAGEDVLAETKQGVTALHFAARGGFVGVSILLLDSGAAVNAAEKQNRHTALHFACRSGEPTLVKVLLAAGADMAATDMDGLTPPDMWLGSEQQWNELMTDVWSQTHGA